MGRIHLKHCLGLLSTALWSCMAYAQPTSVTLTATQDTYIDSRLSTTNYGSSTTLQSATYLDRGSYYYRRSFVEFDLSGIPSGAVIYSATLQMTRSTTVSGGATWKTKMVKSSWAEGSVTASSQPTISDLAKDVVSSSPAGSGYVDEVNVTSMVQRMVAGQVTNYGWSFQLANEGYAGASGATFYSSEESTSSYRPKLVVEYYTPLSLAFVKIEHESDTNTMDGCIHVLLNGGASSNYEYTWVNSSFVTISTDSILDSLHYGWYGLHVRGTTYAEDFYYSFLVGRHGSNVTITAPSSTNYMDNAALNGLASSSDGTNNNYANYATIRSDRWTNGGVWYSNKSIFKPRIWIDPEIVVNQADLTLKGSDHSTLGGSNAATILLLTSDWREDIVTWNFAPTSSSSISENIAATTSTTQNNTIDVKDFFDYWKEDNSLNYGMQFELQNTSNYYHRQVYHSPTAATSTNRPAIEFEVELEPRYISYVLNEEAETAQLAIDLKNFAISSPGPYYYIVSHEPIPPILDLFSFYKDSIFGGMLDSAQFVLMGSNETTLSIDYLEFGLYNVVVFTAEGERIIDEQVSLPGDYELDETNGLMNLCKSLIIGVSSENRGTIKTYISESQNGYFAFKVLNTSEDQYFGVLSPDSTLSGFSDIEYGFIIEDGHLYTIIEGAQSISSYSVSDDDVLYLRFSEGNVDFTRYSELIVSEPLPTSFEYEIGIETGLRGPILVSVSGPLSKKKYNFSSSLTHFTCDGDEGHFSFRVKKVGSVTAYNINYSISDENSVVVQSGTGSTGSQVNVFPGSAGIYTVSGQIILSTNPSVVIPFSEVIYLGYEADWANITSEYSILSQPNSIMVENSSEVSYQLARSKNQMKYNENGWMTFGVVPYNTNAINFIRPTTYNLDSQPNILGLTLEQLFSCSKLSSNYTTYFVEFPPNPSTPLITSNSSPEVRLSFTNDATSGYPLGKVKLYINEVYKTEVPRSSSPIIARFNSLKNLDGFVRVVTSFPCPELNVIYGHLKYELDGYYHTMKEGLIRFRFDQEYSGSNLQFNIYNAMDELILDQSDFSAVSTSYGMNYLELDVTEPSSCLDPGFYYLEVENNKKEKLYLRFYNDVEQTCP